MVCLLEDFMYVEKSGDWKLHLQIVEHMIPFFCATGHFYYAKSTQVYLEDMTSLQLESVAYQLIRGFIFTRGIIERMEKFTTYSFD